jgi:hypothetical protein
MNKLFVNEREGSCEISGCHGSEYEDDNLLGYNAMQSIEVD